MVASTFIPDAYIFPIKPDKIETWRTNVQNATATTEATNLFGFQLQILANIARQISDVPKIHQTDDIIKLIQNNWPKQWEKAPESAIVEKQVAMLLELKEYHVGITDIVGASIGSETPRYERYEH